MKKIEVLHIEDSPLDSELILSELERYGIDVAYRRVMTEKELLTAFEEYLPDIILADYHLPVYDGIKALKVCSTLYPFIPFIFISGKLGEERAVELLKQGASDYILKQNLVRLGPAVEFALKQKLLIAEKKKAKIKLMQSEKKYRKIFETMQDVFCRTDLDGKIEVVSPSVQLISGYHPSELVNKSILVLYEKHDDFFRMIEHLNAHGEIWDFETVSLHKDGSHKYVSINGHFYYDENDIPKGIESTVRDITMRKEVEKELIKAKERAEESDRLKTAFLANISHEIRTPMNGILGFAELLGDADFDSEQKEHVLELVKESGVRMLNIINQILDISLLYSGEQRIKLAPVNLNLLVEIVYNSLRSLAEQKGVTLEYVTPLNDNTGMVNTDEDKLNTILLNIVGNAIKYTQKGSVVFGYEKNDTDFLFFVKDTGIGISSENLKYIFDTFYQEEQEFSRNYEGAGLGLSISKAYIEMLGGCISVESIKGEGSNFHFIIPARGK